MKLKETDYVDKHWFELAQNHIWLAGFTLEGQP
jgi:hypothetical protein